MDELQTIREALDSIANSWASRQGTDMENTLTNADAGSLMQAFAALSHLEARESEWPDTKAIIKAIRTGNLSESEAGAYIGHYAFLYSEDIRKDRDEWKALAEGYEEAVSGLLGR